MEAFLGLLRTQVEVLYGSEEEWQWRDAELLPSSRSVVQDEKIRSAPDLRRYLDICGKTYESEPGRFVQSDGRLSDDFFAVCLAEYKSIRNKVRNRKRD